MLSFPSYKQEFMYKEKLYICPKKLPKYIQKTTSYTKCDLPSSYNTKGKKYLSIIYKDNEQKLQNNQKGSNQYQQKLQG